MPIFNGDISNMVSYYIFKLSMRYFFSWIIHKLYTQLYKKSREAELGILLHFYDSGGLLRAVSQCAYSSNRSGISLLNLIFGQPILSFIYLVYYIHSQSGAEGGGYNPFRAHPLVDLPLNMKVCLFTVTQPKIGLIKNINQTKHILKNFK